MQYRKKNFLLWHEFFLDKRRSEVDIKGYDGIIYKGRIDVDNLPTVDMQKKNSVVLLGPAPPQKSRSDLHPRSAPQQRRHEPFVNHSQEVTSRSPIIPTIETTISGEENFSWMQES